MDKILVVDDDAYVSKALRRELENHFEVVLASSGQAGLEVLEKVAPQLVMSDFKMNGMNGAEFLAEVKRRLPAAARVLISGYADLAAATDSPGVGDILFVKKPWGPELAGQLQERIGTHLGR